MQKEKKTQTPKIQNTSQKFELTPTEDQQRIIKLFLSYSKGQHEPLISYQDEDYDSKDQKVKYEKDRFALMIFAGPGTGKTQLSYFTIQALLIQKIISQNDFLFLTFNKSLIKKINNSLRQVIPKNLHINTQKLFTQTLNAFALKVINNKIKRKVINLSDQKVKKAITQILQKQFGNICTNLNIIPSNIKTKKIKQQSQIANNDQEKNKKITNRIYHRISEMYAKNENLDSYRDSLQKNKGTLTQNQRFDLQIIKIYLLKDNQMASQQNKYTFDKMICQAVKIIRQTPIQNLPLNCRTKYIIIDQFQDLSKAQLDLIEALLQKNPKRCLLLLGDPDQNIYVWRYAKYENLNNFVQNLKKIHKIPVLKDSLTLNHRLHKNIFQLSMSYIKTDHQSINYKNIRQNIYKKVKNCEKIIWKQQKKDEQIFVQQYQNQFDEIMSIIQRIYKLNKQKKVKFNQMTILLRSVIYQSFFIQKLKFIAKQFQTQKKAEGENIQIPFLQLLKKTIFQDERVRFIIRSFQYYYYIVSNRDLEDKSKTTIINKILSSIQNFGTLGQKYGKMMAKTQFNLNAILDQQRWKQYEQYFIKNQAKLNAVKKFRQKFKQFLVMCENKNNTIVQLTDFLIKQFFNQNFMKLKTNENVEDFVKYVNLAQNQNKDWKVFFENINSNYQQMDIKNLPNKVIIQTLHKSKGQTFKVVFLPSMNLTFEVFGQDEDIPQEIDMKQRKNEQFRLYYTGITRTKGSLYATRTTKSGWKASQPKRQFQFLKKNIPSESFHIFKTTLKARTYEQKYFNQVKQKKKRQQQDKNKKSANSINKKKSSKRKEDQAQSDQQVENNRNNQNKESQSLIKKQQNILNQQDDDSLNQKSQQQFDQEALLDDYLKNRQKQKIKQQQFKQKNNKQMQIKRKKQQLKQQLLKSQQKIKYQNINNKIDKKMQQKQSSQKTPYYDNWIKNGFKDGQNGHKKVKLQNKNQQKVKIQLQDNKKNSFGKK